MSEVPSTPPRGGKKSEKTDASIPPTADGVPLTPTPTQRYGLRRGFAALREKANLQDKFMEKLLSQVIPTEGNTVSFAAADYPTHEKPNFNLATMSHNFRTFNARIGVVFEFQEKAARLFSWHDPSNTLSFLAVFTFVCLDPYLLFCLPIFILLVSVLIPAFLARHPAPPKGTLSSAQGVGYSASGPPTAPAATVQPAKELSTDFFQNMRHLQNSMGDFTVAYDKVVESVVPVTNFSDEALSSTVFIGLLFSGVIMTITAHILPWRFVFLLGGWVGIVCAHPAVGSMIAASKQQQQMEAQGEKAKTWLDNWIAEDVILDSAPETREVEVFELQKRSSAREWEPWVFGPTPFDPLSQNRLTGDRPRGTRFFEDVMPPEGWEWSEKKWALDLFSREWVEERIITGVEVETGGQRWVYDMYEEAEEQIGVLDEPAGKNRTRPMPSWEEGEEYGSTKKGDWRRRRWVRLVKRKVSTGVYA